MNQPPVFVISLDFELHWGGFEKWSLNPDTTAGKHFRSYFLNTRNVIPEILSTMQCHGIHATWATVGLLFHESLDELQSSASSLPPTYLNQHLSAYHFLNEHGIGKDENDDPFHFAPSLIRQILQTPGMEVGSQTYTHYFACEPGQTVAQFRADLQAACEVAKSKGITLKSLVLPRNQINSNYLSVCSELGFQSVRVNPDNWFWALNEHSHDSRWKGFFRNLDDLFPYANLNSFSAADIKKTIDGLLLIPASRFLRPYQTRLPFLNELRIRKILREMESAAKIGKIYHFWWHPHNFGSYPRESMTGLIRILNHFQKLKKDYGMVSMNMAELSSMILKQGV